MIVGLHRATNATVDASSCQLGIPVDVRRPYGSVMMTLAPR
jgi:hypothetical protein